MHSDTPRKTPLHDTMVAQGGKIVDFHGWALPVQFSGILQEHKAVRTACGIFDVSHMGQVFVTGKDAFRFLQHVNANNIKDIPGKGVYSHVLNERAGLVDDIIAFCLAPEKFYVVVNAATTQKDADWFVSHSKGFDVKIENASDRYGMIALQGPKSLGLMEKLCPKALELGRFCILETKIFGVDAFITRTGYTGEDGFEVATSNENIIKVWNYFIENGKDAGIVPCGLGARDTLRLEAGYLLYGQDVDDDHTTYEANYGWVVKLKKEEFIGKEILVKQKAEGIKRKLTGFVMVQPGVPRNGCAIYRGGVKIGELVSATFSPNMGKGIGVGYVTPADLPVGEPVEIEIHSRRVGAKVAKVPFYENKV